MPVYVRTVSTILLQPLAVRQYLTIVTCTKFLKLTLGTNVDVDQL